MQFTRNIINHGLRVIEIRHYNHADVFGEIKLLITRIDKRHINRDDVFTTQAEIATADINRQESNPSSTNFYDISQTKTLTTAEDTLSSVTKSTH